MSPGSSPLASICKGQRALRPHGLVLTLAQGLLQPFRSAFSSSHSAIVTAVPYTAARLLLRQLTNQRPLAVAFPAFNIYSWISTLSCVSVK